MAARRKAQPRIITETVTLMREVAARLVRVAAAHGLELAGEIDELRAGATKLDGSDARETQPDPSKRKRRPRPAQRSLGLSSSRSEQ
jgi:hypothetical protein